MLSEDAIENLVQPMIDRQESINIMVLETIAKRVRAIGTMKPADIDRLKLLVQMGADIRQINAELAKLTNSQIVNIKRIIKTVALDSYIDAKPLYDYRHKSFIPFSKNTNLQKVVSAVEKVTVGEYKNISNSKATGFLVGKNFTHTNLHPQNLQDTYRQIIDRAIQSTKSGIDYKVAMRTALQQLSDSGLRRISWDSGYTQRLDTAVRRNIMDGIHAIQQAMEDKIAEQIGADAKELSVHENCALDHEPIQGHIFKNEEYEKLQNDEDFEDIKGNKFTSIRRAIGMWNCRHFAYAYIIGVSKPRYTQAQLDQYIKRNHKGYTLSNGKHLTMYECTQMQRQLETRIRYAKEAQMVWKEAGDDFQARLAKKKVERLLNEYRIFSNNCGLDLSLDRTSVLGYVSKI